MKIEPEATVVFFDPEFPELLAILAGASSVQSWLSPSARQWAYEQYNKLAAYMNNRG